MSDVSANTSTDIGADISTKQVKATPEMIEEAGRILRDGGLVAFPTETVYGLGADALNEEAATKTYAAKGRPGDNPLIVHIADWDSLSGIARKIPPDAELLAKRFWPGPLTMIFEKKDVVPYGTTGGLDTVAVRMPADRIALDLIRAAGGYVSAPSANASGRPSPTCAAHVTEDLSGKIDMILDGGSVDIGVESTILDMTEDPPVILRPGAVTREMLTEVVPCIRMDAGLVRADIRPKAPGMKYRHYAPRAKMFIVCGEPDRVCGVINEAAAKHREKGEKAAVIATKEYAARYSADRVCVMGSRSDQESIAHSLYGILRQLDEEAVDVIYSEALSRDGLGEAIMNRMDKAAGYTILNADAPEGTQGQPEQEKVSHKKTKSI